ncbi:hypothetical protein TRICHSKD4_3342 [Roseibium sp. TrichSKD4]|uniref:hypothetical protein n=1 Tax=Roseibium sp. TrichSKD4 TaxID=744980 RepID=UPI0001E56F42|nr:hypothetical protein [Roseibium sp. TrichSKD4]EFO31325.1 hypothetical protein TRICHSKD4_3342 [Roseibium sp. TrichSKD4]
MSKKNGQVEIKVGLIDKITAPMRRVEKALDRLSRPIKKIKRAFSTLADASGLAKVGERVRGLTKRVKTLGVTIAGAGIAATAAATKMVTGFAGAGDAIAKMGRATGMNVETLQALRYAGDRSGVDKASFDTSAMTFSKRLGEMKSGSGPMYAFLKKVGPELAKRMVAENDPTKAFEMALEALSEIKDESKRAAAATAMFGRSGQRMALFGEAGPEAIEKLKAEAFHLGAVISAEDAANGENLTDAMTNLGVVFEGLSNSIGASLAPVVTDLINKFNELVANNKELIRAWAENFAKDLPGHLKDLKQIISDVGETFGKIKSAIETVTGPVSNLELAIGALGAITLGPLVASILSVGAALLKVALIMLFNPVGLIIAGIAGAALLIMDNWSELVSWWEGAWQKIAAAFDKGWVTGVWEVWNQFNPLTLIIKSLDHLSEKWLEFSPVDVVNGWLAELGALAGRFYEEMAALGRDMVNGILDGLASGWNELTSWLEEKMAGLRSLIDLGWLGEKLGLTSAPQTPPPIAQNDNRKSSVAARISAAHEVGAEARKSVHHNKIDSSIGSLSVHVTSPPGVDPMAFGARAGQAATGPLRKQQQAATASLRDG